MRRWLLAVIAFGLVGGCQKSQDRATEAVVERIIASKGRESNVAIDREKGEIRVTLGGPVKPSGWPQAVPIYPQAEKAKIERADGASQRLSVVTGDGISELRAYYREALGKSGWEIRDGDAADVPWTARRGGRGGRGGEDLEIRFAERGRGKGSRAEFEYRKNS